MAADLHINGTLIPHGTRKTIGLPLPKLYTHTPISMPVHIIRGKRSGPRLFICAAIHGDELNGVEIIRRILQLPSLSRLRGTLIAVPAVNLYGLLHHSRYLPDRRDLNRSFPGSEKGSLTARIARFFIREIVTQCTHGIDLHTGAIHRSNLPHIRANLENDATRLLAKAFGAPVILNSVERDGSLREAASEMGVPVLLYEAGEALRFDEMSIRAGVKGVINVLRFLDMLPKTRRKRFITEPVEARSSSWVRAPASGMLRILKPLGQTVSKGDLLALVDDLYGEEVSRIEAPFSGIIIGRTELPLIHEGEALFHLARFEDLKEAEQQIEGFQEKNSEGTVFELKDEPPVI